MPSRRRPPALTSDLAALFRFCEPQSQELRDRLFEKLQSLCEVDHESGCWIYCGAWDRGGRGRMRVGRHVFSVKRVAAWIYRGGFELARGKVVAGTCGTPACFNPDHLLVAADWADAWHRLKRLGRYDRFLRCRRKGRRRPG